VDISTQLTRLPLSRDKWPLSSVGPYASLFHHQTAITQNTGVYFEPFKSHLLQKKTSLSIDGIFYFHSFEKNDPSSEKWKN
jgi:hypothetical protein